MTILTILHSMTIIYSVILNCQSKHSNLHMHLRKRCHVEWRLFLGNPSLCMARRSTKDAHASLCGIAATLKLQILPNACPYICILKNGCPSKNLSFYSWFYKMSASSVSLSLVGTQLWVTVIMISCHFKGESLEFMCFIGKPKF